MPKDLFGRILSHDLESSIPLSRTMDFNLIVKPSRDTVTIWELKTGIPFWPIHKGMDKTTLSIRS